MAIVNVTPDSFSDGGRCISAADAIRRANECVEEGADIVDIGGESTRPGASVLSWHEEWRRIKEVVENLSRLALRISVDTYHVETAERAADLGVEMINCVYEKSVPGMLALKDSHPALKFVIPSKSLHLAKDIFDDIYIDPMIGFGTTREEDIELLRSIPSLASQAKTLVGVSRKRITKYLSGENSPADATASVALAVWSAMKGASCVRVHDVRQTVAALRTISQL